NLLLIRQRHGTASAKFSARRRAVRSIRDWHRACAENRWPQHERMSEPAGTRADLAFRRLVEPRPGSPAGQHPQHEKARHTRRKRLIHRAFLVAGVGFEPTTFRL